MAEAAYYNDMAQYLYHPQFLVGYLPMQTCRHVPYAYGR